MPPMAENRGRILIRFTLNLHRLFHRQRPGLDNKIPLREIKSGSRSHVQRSLFNERSIESWTAGCGLSLGTHGPIPRNFPVENNSEVY
jgi:hypothetical protein